jgi:SsrA-binding protein
MSIVQNKKAFHDYFIEDRFEAGIALEGWEVKAIRAGRVQIKEAYVIVSNGELYLIGCLPLKSAGSSAASNARATPCSLWTCTTGMPG